MHNRKKLEIFIYLLLIFGLSLMIENLFYGLLFIFIHELCHVLSSYLLGYKVENIKLIPFGFTSNIKEEFIRPFDDIIISISGPLINFIFFVFFYYYGIVFNSDTSVFKQINLILFVFNIIPAEFLDGGRIIRTILKLNISFYAAYVVSIFNGLLLSLLLIFSAVYTKSLLNGIILFIIAMYVIISCYKSKKNIIIHVIKDIFLKKNYLNECTSINIKIRAFNGNNNLLSIIKYFSFKKYYIIYLLENDSIKYRFYEADIISIYCSKGNIKLSECINFVNT